MVDTSDEWIRQRTGIPERCVADSRETTASTSLQAAQAALDVAELHLRKMELVVVATLPSTRRLHDWDSDVSLTDKGAQLSS